MIKNNKHKRDTKKQETTNKTKQGILQQLKMVTRKSNITNAGQQCRNTDLKFFVVCFHAAKPAMSIRMAANLQERAIPGNDGYETGWICHCIMLQNRINYHPLG